MYEDTVSSFEAALMLEVSKETIIRWCRSGKLKGAYQRNRSRRLGWRIPKSTIVWIVDAGRGGYVSQPVSP